MRAIDRLPDSVVQVSTYDGLLQPDVNFERLWKREFCVIEYLRVGL